jgi:hypothetical protein
MIVTTSARADEQTEQYAKHVANILSTTYVTRKKQSVTSIQSVYQSDVIVVGKGRIELFPYGEADPFFFHPNSAMFRLKRLVRNEHDPFIEVAQLQEGSSILDCTLGLASDSVTASYVVGPTGRVVGIEGNPYIAFLVQKGLQDWDSGIQSMNEAMRRVEVISGFAENFLKEQPDNSYDCVYFDPMFEESIVTSVGIKGLSKFAVYHEMTDHLVNEALRVAKRRVVLKDHYQSSRFQKFGFNVITRKSAKFHYGFLE